MAHEEYGRLVYQDEFGLLDLPLPRLPGRHQYANAAAAIRAVKAAGFDGHRADDGPAMTTVEWPGRLQTLTEGKLVRHAPAGRRNLARRRAQSGRRRRDRRSDGRASKSGSHDRCS